MMWMQRIIASLSCRVALRLPGLHSKPAHMSRFLSISDSYDSLHLRQGILKRTPIVWKWKHHVSNSGH